MSFKLRNERVLDAWIETGPTLGDRTRVLAWLFELCEDPFAVECEEIRPTTGLADRVATVPNTDTQVVFSIAKPSVYDDHVVGIYLRAIS